MEKRWSFTLPCPLPLQVRKCFQNGPSSPAASRRMTSYPPVVSLRVHFWAASAHTTWVRTAEKWRRARLEGDGDLPSPHATHFTTTEAVLLLAAMSVHPGAQLAGSVAKCAQARSLASPRGAIVAPAAVTDRGFGCHPSTLESILLINGTAAFCVC